MSDLTIPNTTWQQISVGTKMACGAREPAGSAQNNSLRFKVHNKPQRYIEVILDADDTYDVCYFRLKRGTSERIIMEQTQGVYNDMLSEIIYHMVNK